MCKIWDIVNELYRETVSLCDYTLGSWKLMIFQSMMRIDNIAAAVAGDVFRQTLSCWRFLWLRISQKLWKLSQTRLEDFGRHCRASTAGCHCDAADTGVACQLLACAWSRLNWKSHPKDDSSWLQKNAFNWDSVLRGFLMKSIFFSKLESVKRIPIKIYKFMKQPPNSEVVSLSL